MLVDTSAEGLAHEVGQHRIEVEGRVLHQLLRDRDGRCTIGVSLERYRAEGRSSARVLRVLGYDDSLGIGVVDSRKREVATA